MNYLGEFAAAQNHLAQGMPSTTPSSTVPMPSAMARTPGWHPRLWRCEPVVVGLSDQALQRSHEAVTLARELAHPFSLGFALFLTSWVPQFRREGPLTQERAEAAIALATEHGFAVFGAGGRFSGVGAGPAVCRAWCRTGARGGGHRPDTAGLAACAPRGRGASAILSCPARRSRAGRRRQVEEGLHLLAEALAVANDTGECRWDAEMYRLKGELLLARPAEHHVEAEICLRQARDIARQQQAKSLELRAGMSFSRLWQQQGKRARSSRTAGADLRLVHRGL